MTNIQEYQSTSCHHFVFVVWSILQRSTHGLTMYTYNLPQQPVLTEMTAGETAFKLRVEEMLAFAKKPVHRQIIVEVCVCCSFFFPLYT